MDALEKLKFWPRGSAETSFLRAQLDPEFLGSPRLSRTNFIGSLCPYVAQANRTVELKGIDLRSKFPESSRNFDQHVDSKFSFVYKVLVLVTYLHFGTCR